MISTLGFLKTKSSGVLLIDWSYDSHATNMGQNLQYLKDKSKSGNCKYYFVNPGLHKNPHA